MHRVNQVEAFYASMAELEAKLSGARTVAECSGRHDWPRRGVYFFREDGEVRSDTGNGPSIVRVGTHALTETSRTSLWTRLAQHRGQRAGGGNHRGSIFRLLVGTALIARDGLRVPTWGVGASATRDVRESEVALERQVSEVIGRMQVLWLAIEDEPGGRGLRGFVERSAIALLSNCNKPPVDPSSDSWLGGHCARERVRASGLWNSNHIDKGCDAAFLGVLERLVVETASGS